ncbi:beta-ketoacyl synthase N-terminal-like domain-containing protein, partial [Saccharothrix lopnurensis]
MTPPRVAVVGLACRYPDADGPGELWENVLAGRRAFRRLPPARLADAYRGDQPDLTCATHAAVLRDWSFDRAAFGIPGPLHRAADHAHWLALETAAAVLADAGVPGGEGLDRDTAGVVIGNSLTGEFTRAGLLRLRWPFVADAAATALRGAGVGEEASAEVLRRMRALVKDPFPVPGDETLAGALANTIAGRVCNHFDFHGTGYTVDGACSSSLLAVITACRALVEGDLDFAVAGGVDLSLDPLELVGFARLGALARGDRMRVFDAEPTGFLPGEGCGMVALARAEDAERLGLRVYAHLVGWGTSSDGAGGLTRPETAGQELAMRRAYRRARVDPADVGLVEGHGTGTPVGDRVELEALARLRGPAAPEAALGSVKGNIGHTKAAAGVAGLIKAVQAVHSRVLPPTTGCERPHELLRDSPLRVLPEAEPWTEPLPCAAVSSMGFGGINAHVVVEAAVRRRTAAALSAATRRWAARVPGPEVVVLAAADRRELVARLERLAAVAGSFSEAVVRDAAGTAWRDLRPGGHRAALVAGTPAGLADAAAAAARAASDRDGEVVLDRRAGFALGTAGGRVGLLFPGQAAPVRLALPGWAERLDVPALPAAPGGRDGDVDTAVAQPAVVRHSMAALAWLEEAGCVPVGAVGHSLGEIAALCWAGALPPAAAVDLAAARGRVMARHAVPDTGMASLDCAPDAVAALVAGTPVVVAAHNGPDRVVVAGERAAVAEVLRRARAGGVTGAALPVSHGFHSPAMLPAREPLRAVLAGVRLDRPDLPVFSTVTGEALDPDADLRDLLVRQLTEPVRFTSALARLAERCDLLVEAGPGTVLSGLAAGCGTPVVALDVGGDGAAHAFAAAALAAVAGVGPGPWFADRPFRPIALDAEPAVLGNPCEDRSGWEDAVRAAETDAAGVDAAGVDAAGTAVTGTAAAGVDGPEPVAVADRDPLTALTSYLADTLELPLASITPTSSLLGDLHLNSLQVVQAVAAVATALGRALPEAPLSLAGATVGEAAEVLAALP